MTNWVTILCLLTFFTLTINSLPIEKGSSLKPFTLDDFLGSKFYFPGFNGTWISDKLFRYRHKDGNLNTYNAETDEHSLYLSANVLNNLNSSNYQFSPDYTKILVNYDQRQIFRHSKVSKFKIYDINTTNFIDVANASEIQICRWSPVGNNLVFIKDNDVYYKKLNENNNEIRLTFTGINGIIYNGIADWVYEEEVLSSDGALWFSPDGNLLAIASFNDTKVEEYQYTLYGKPGDMDFQYPTYVRLRYPKPNTTNPDVTLRYIDLNKKTPTESDWIKLEAPTSIVTNDFILYNVEWSFNDNMLVTWVNRRQNKGAIQSCNATTSICNTIHTLNESKGWIEPNTDLKCHLDGSSCYFITNYNGWYHIVNLNIKTGQLTPKTNGNFTILNIIGLKERTNELFYKATLPHHPEQQHIFRNDICLSCNVTGPEDQLCTYASALFSKNYTYYALTCNGPTPSYTKIFETNTNIEVIFWQDNLAERKTLEEYQKINNYYIRVPVEGGFEAAVKLMLPPELKLNDTNSILKYPMIVYVYGGPNSVRVSDGFSIGFPDYMVTSKKVIYCQIDGRGSGNKGTNMLFAINNRLGTVEIEDQIAVTKFLQDNYNYIDIERTSIWGWSYGGYATVVALSKDVNRVFQCGISVAPVTSWIYYDSIYTERYMGLPTIDDNIIGYNESDVTRQVKGIKSHDFLLIHGNADDNVHFQQAMALSRALQKESILFEQMSYPDENHGLGGVSSHLYHTMDEFWTKCLNLGSEDDL